MRMSERWSYLKRSPQLLGDILFRGQYDFKFDLMPVHITRMPMKKRVNLLRAGMNLIHRRLYPWSWPLNMMIELTSYCNLRCSVCPIGIGTLKRPPSAMDPILFERLMNEVGPYLLTASLWGWGEPLLHPQLSTILRLAQKRGITTLLSTNGQNLNDVTVLQALISYPPTFLIVALDGITDETNSVYRVGSKVQLALDGIHRLAKMKAERGSQFPILHLRFIAMRHNEHELPLLQKFAADNLFDVLSIRTLAIIDAPDDTHMDLIPRNEVYRAYGYDKNKRIKRDDFLCEKAFTFPAVLADGTVIACDQDFNAQQQYGSIGDGTAFAEIWWNRQAADIRKTIRDNPDKFSFCQNCPFRDRPIGPMSAEYYDLRKIS